MLNACVETRKGDTNLTNYLVFAGCWPVTWSAGEVRVTQPWPATGRHLGWSLWPVTGVFYCYPDLPNHLLKQVDGII